MKLTAQRLILDLASTLDDEAIPVRALVRAAAAFGITGNSVRVALARLLSRGLLARDERGSYRLAGAARPVQSHVASWTQVERRKAPWRGDWIAVQTAGLGPNRRAALRRRQRALDFLGFRELSPDLWVRPRNLRSDVVGTRARLHELGLETRAPVFVMSGLDDSTEARASGLWDVEALEESYRELVNVLARSTRELPELPVEKAITECFLIGGDVLRRIAFDPLLPEPILPASSLRELVEAMRAYDRVGRARWREFLTANDAPQPKYPRHMPLVHAEVAPPIASWSAATAVAVGAGR